jgi:hypothetical protein
MIQQENKEHNNLQTTLRKHAEGDKIKKNNVDGASARCEAYQFTAKT